MGHCGASECPEGTVRTDLMTLDTLDIDKDRGRVVMDRGCLSVGGPLAALRI